ncbi:MAG: hypothetical protein P1U36_01100 [Legionellaceae bacterium]|nr:hypothetical protein [Legionellaceae bacterium]
MPTNTPNETSSASLSAPLSIETNLSTDSESESEIGTPFRMSSRYAMFTKRFEPKLNNGNFLGETSGQRDSEQYCQFIQTSSIARTKFEFEDQGTFLHGKPSQSIELKTQAVTNTKRAASDFFALAYQALNETNEAFPLAGKNKCLGMVVVPGKTLVLLAISQDKNPTEDVILRQKMVRLLNRINAKEGHAWTFELACIPTKSQYMMPRTLFMRTIHPAPNEWVEPHTRCVEVSLMVALCKTGRHISFNPEDTGVMAFGGTLWSIPWRLKKSNAIPHFEGATRNSKYTTQPPISVDLGDGTKGWIDIWDPCAGHCKIYRQEMLAIGASGGPATSFTEPRSETNITPITSML